MVLDKKPSAIVKYLNRYVMGQDDAKKTLRSLSTRTSGSSRGRGPTTRRSPRATSC
jgi:hypothetical protein